MAQRYYHVILEVHESGTTKLVEMVLEQEETPPMLQDLARGLAEHRTVSPGTTWTVVHCTELRYRDAAAMCKRLGKTLTAEPPMRYWHISYTVRDKDGHVIGAGDLMCTCRKRPMARDLTEVLKRRPALAHIDHSVITSMTEIPADDYS